MIIFICDGFSFIIFFRVWCFMFVTWNMVSAIQFLNLPDKYNKRCSSYSGVFANMNFQSHMESYFYRCCNSVLWFLNPFQVLMVFFYKFFIFCSHFALLFQTRCFCNLYAWIFMLSLWLISCLNCTSSMLENLFSLSRWFEYCLHSALNRKCMSCHSSWRGFS